MDKTIRRVTDLKEQKAETYRYWRSRTLAERLVAIWETTAEAYAFKQSFTKVPEFASPEVLRGLLRALHVNGAKYLVVGAYAIGLYSEPRATGDLDLFIRPDLRNSEALYCALVERGESMAGLSATDFGNNRDPAIRIGHAPTRIDFVQGID